MDVLNATAPLPAAVHGGQAMKFRRRRASNVYDIHAARSATSGIGAYEGPNWSEHEYPKPPSPALVGDGRPPLSAVHSPARVESGGHSIASLVRLIDNLKLENQQLRSERDQAIAQRDIARRQRDDVKAAAAQYKGMRP